MDISVQATTLVALLLGVVRATGFILTAPPFTNGAIPVAVRGALAMCFSLVLYPHIVADVPAVTIAWITVTAVTELMIGIALGFLVKVLFTAVQAAGDIIDLAGGFTLQPAFDPLSMTQNAAIGKLYYLLATTLLFTSGGHLMLVSGFVKSYKALPLGATLPTDQLAHMLITTFALMFLSAIQIAGPLVAVLLLADLGLGLLNRAAPTLNIFTLGFPVKILVSLSLLGLSFPLLPAAMENLLIHAGRAMSSLGVGGG